MQFLLKICIIYLIGSLATICEFHRIHENWYTRIFKYINCIKFSENIIAVMTTKIAFKIVNTVYKHNWHCSSQKRGFVLCFVSLLKVWRRTCSRILFKRAVEIHVLFQYKCLTLQRLQSFLFHTWILVVKH